MSSERKESHQHKALIPFSPIQCQTFFNVIADFLPEGSKIKNTVSSLAGKINNPHLCGKTESFLLSPSPPLLSLAAYAPPEKFPSSPCGGGEAANKAISALKILSKNFEVRLVNNNFINQDRFVKKLPLEMQLMIKQGKDIPELTNFLEKDGTLLFVKRKRIDKDIENLVYDLSLYSGRRLDWLGSWIKNPEGFNLINHFGKRTEKELKKIERLLNQLKKASMTFFQIVPINKDGSIDKRLEKQLNDPAQPIEDAYTLMVLTKQDMTEDLRTVKYATIMSIPTIGLISLILGGDNNTNQTLKLISARSIAPILADAITYWAEVSPFINRNKSFKQKTQDFISILVSNYKTSLLLTLFGTPAGQLAINQLIVSGNNIGAGFVYGATPLIPAITTTAQSVIKEHKSTTTDLKKLDVNGFANMSKQKLWLESILKTVKHPARLGLLVAGLIGVFEGILIGKAELLSNPIALTFVGELNEALLTALWLFSYDKIQQLKYKQQVKKLVNQ